MDPLPSSVMEANRYAYVNNNPCNYTDPTGLHECLPGTDARGWYLGWTSGTIWLNERATNALAQLLGGGGTAATTIAGFLMASGVGAPWATLVGIGSAIMGFGGVALEAVDTAGGDCGVVLRFGLSRIGLPWFYFMAQEDYAVG